MKIKNLMIGSMILIALTIFLIIINLSTTESTINGKPVFKPDLIENLTRIKLGDLELPECEYSDEGICKTFYVNETVLSEALSIIKSITDESLINESIEGLRSVLFEMPEDELNEFIESIKGEIYVNETTTINQTIYKDIDKTLMDSINEETIVKCSFIGCVAFGDYSLIASLIYSYEGYDLNGYTFDDYYAKLDYLLRNNFNYTVDDIDFALEHLSEPFKRLCALGVFSDEDAKLLEDVSLLFTEGFYKSKIDAVNHPFVNLSYAMTSIVYLDTSAVTLLAPFFFDWHNGYFSEIDNYNGIVSNIFGVGFFNASSINCPPNFNEYNTTITGWVDAFCDCEFFSSDLFDCSKCVNKRIRVNIQPVTYHVCDNGCEKFGIFQEGLASYGVFVTDRKFCTYLINDFDAMMNALAYSVQTIK